MMAMRLTSKRWTTCTSIVSWNVCGDDPSTGKSEDEGCFWGWDRYILPLRPLCTSYRYAHCVYLTATAPTVYTLPLRLHLPVVFPRAASRPYAFILEAPSHNCNGIF